MWLLKLFVFIIGELPIPYFLSILYIGCKEMEKFLFILSIIGMFGGAIGIVAFFRLNSAKPEDYLQKFYEEEDFY